MLRIRAFRAIEDYQSCKRFSDGHEHVLDSYKIPKIATTDTSWFKNPSVFAIIVESITGDKTYGGARIHITNHTHKLPIQKALGSLDPNIHKIVNEYEVGKVGEICALWNSKEIAGKGYSELLTRAGVAKAGIVIANLLELNSLFVLCAPWTTKLVQEVGFRVEESVGNKGTFHYPKPDLLATLFIIKDLKELKLAKPIQRNSILDLREKPKQKRVEHTKSNELWVEYDLEIK